PSASIIRPDSNTTSSRSPSRDLCVPGLLPHLHSPPLFPRLVFQRGRTALRLGLPDLQESGLSWRLRNLLRSSNRKQFWQPEPFRVQQCREFEQGRLSNRFFPRSGYLLVDPEVCFFASAGTGRCSSVCGTNASQS